MALALWKVLHVITYICFNFISIRPLFKQEALAAIKKTNLFHNCSGQDRQRSGAADEPTYKNDANVQFAAVLGPNIHGFVMRTGYSVHAAFHLVRIISA